MINGLFAVTLKTADAKKLAKFYVDVVGLTVDKKSSDIIMLKLGGDQMLVIQEDEHIKPVSDPQTQVRGSIAFKVSDVNAVHKRLKGMKVKIDAGKGKDKKGAGFKSITTFDPEGNRVDYVQPS